MQWSMHVCCVYFPATRLHSSPSSCLWVFSALVLLSSARLQRLWFRLWLTVESWETKGPSGCAGVCIYFFRCVLSAERLPHWLLHISSSTCLHPISTLHDHQQKRSFPLREEYQPVCAKIRFLAPPVEWFMMTNESVINHCFLFEFYS